jgi:micrococcal nuclease
MLPSRLRRSLLAVHLALAVGLAASASAASEPARVVRVIDGDTVAVEIGGKPEHLRLIGLNTPESVDPRRPVQCFGREASAHAKALLPPGTRVTLERDPVQGDRDRYRRLLRYLFLPDGRNFAEAMIAEGFGLEYTYRLPYRYQTAFREAQRDAQRAARGLWSQAACGGDPTKPAGRPAVARRAQRSGTAGRDAAVPCRPGQIKGNRNSGIYHLPGGAAYADVRRRVACFDSEAAALGAGFRRAGR